MCHMICTLHHSVLQYTKQGEYKSASISLENHIYQYSVLVFEGKEDGVVFADIVGSSGLFQFTAIR